jgi:hypothetical protein
VLLGCRKSSLSMGVQTSVQEDPLKALERGREEGKFHLWKLANTHVSVLLHSCGTGLILLHVPKPYLLIKVVSSLGSGTVLLLILGTCYLCLYSALCLVDTVSFRVIAVHRPSTLNCLVSPADDLFALK